MRTCTKCGVTSENFQPSRKTQCRDCIRAGQRKRNQNSDYIQKRKEDKAKWYKENSEVQINKAKKHQDSKKLSHYVVYHLPKEHYCGVTQNTYHRMANHKHFGNDITDWVVIHKCETRAGALAIEAQYHAKGWLGAKGYKNTLQNLLSCDT